MDRAVCIKKVGVSGICGNIFLLIIKFTVGMMFHSQAMIADAANSAGDIFASVMTTIGNMIARVPKDNNHNFGHGKAEYLFSMFISISMVFIALKLLWDSAFGLIYGSSFTFSWLLIIVGIVSLIVKIFLFIYSRNLYKQSNSILIKSACEDHRNDCFLIVCTLISIVSSYFGVFFIDGIVGIGISLWICFSGSKIFIEAYNVLMDTSVDGKTKDIIYEFSRTYPGIKKIDNISSAPVGYKYIIFITIYVDGNMSTFESHKIADDLEKDVEQLDNIYDAIIHVNPI